MLLSEPPYLSLQGEGKLTGMPMVFVRMAGCDPPHCEFCDQPESQKGGVEFSPETVAGRIRDLTSGTEIRWICFTGGEPMLQQEALVQTIEKLKPEFYVTIETSGRIKPSQKLVELVDFWSISPKLSNSGRLTPDRKLLNESIFMIPSSADFQLKFVVSSLEDCREAQELAVYLGGIRYHWLHGKLWLQPVYEGMDHIDKEGFSPWDRDLADLIIKQFPEFRLSLQTHKILGIK